MGILGYQCMKMPINSEGKFREMGGEVWEKEVLVPNDGKYIPRGGVN